MARALLIGINHYFSFRPLEGPLKDVEDMKAWLTSQGVDKIDVLLSEPGQDVYSATPIAAQVEDWLRKLHGEVAKITKNNNDKTPDFPLGDRLYVFFAGHGYDASTAGATAVFPRSQRGYWDVFPFMPMVRHLKSEAFFNELVVLIDACREAIDYAGDPNWNMKSKAHKNATQVRVFTLCPGSGEKTKELDFAVGKRGVLTQAFLSGAKGIAAEGGKVDANRLRDYMVHAIWDKISGADPEIHPPNTPLVVANAPTINPKIEITCQPGSAGNAVLKHNSGGENQIVLQAGKNVPIEVPWGAYTLVLPNGSEKPINALWEVNHVEV